MDDLAKGKASSSFHDRDDDPSLQESLSQHDPLYRWLVKMVNGLVYLAYVVVVGGSYIATMGTLTVLAVAITQLAFHAPELIKYYDPLFEIRIDYSLMVLDDPTIFVSYRLNDLFSKFDPEILQKMQLKMFMRTIADFHVYLGSLKGGDLEDVFDKVQCAALYGLVAFLKDVPFQKELLPEAIHRMQNWMEEHPVESTANQ